MGNTISKNNCYSTPNCKRESKDIFTINYMFVCAVNKLICIKNIIRNFEVQCFLTHSYGRKQARSDGAAFGAYRINGTACFIVQQEFPISLWPGSSCEFHSATKWQLEAIDPYQYLIRQMMDIYSIGSP